MVITRFAPSPTGRFHVGVARTALFSYLWAKKNSGKFILRIDDTDKERSKKEYEEEIKEGLKFLGIEWDFEFRQSERIEIYQKIAFQLIKDGYAYKCYCTPEELERYREEALRKKISPKYPGICRNKKQEVDEAKPFAIRFRVPEEEFEVEFEDIVMGKIKVKTVDIEDFTLLRSDRTPTYNLASCVDDADFKITHIIRGADHISNTPKQILLFKVLGHIPQFAHIPLVLPDEGKGKISKRAEKEISEIYISELKKDGFLKEAIVNHLARLGWAYGDKEIFSIDELVKLFDIKDINRSPARYNFDKLYWLNSEWIRILDDREIVQRLKDFMNIQDEPKVLSIIPQVKVRVKTLKEMAEMIKPIFGITMYDEEGKEKFLKNEKAKKVLEEIVVELEKIKIESENARAEFDKMMKNIAEKYGEKVVFVAQVMRMAIYGKLVSPPLFDVIKVIGKENVIERINSAIKLIEHQNQK
jgi:glutamyl-tRNA synthetase